MVDIVEIEGLPQSPQLTSLNASPLRLHPEPLAAHAAVAAEGRRKANQSRSAGVVIFVGESRNPGRRGDHANLASVGGCGPRNSLRRTPRPQKHGPALGLGAVLRREPCRATNPRGPTKQVGVSNVVPAIPIGGGAMTTVANLLARKQRLVEQLHENPGPNERAEIDRLLAQVDAALDLLEEAGPPRRVTSDRRL
jgi:hypothetical protein